MTPRPYRTLSVAVVAFCFLLAPSLVLAQEDETPSVEVAAPKGPAPWKKPVAATDEVRPPETFREALTNVEDEEIEALADGEPLDPLDSTLRKIFYRLPRIGVDTMLKFAAKNESTELAALVDDPAAHRLDVFHLRGRVHGIALVELPDELARFSEFTHYYQVTFKTEGLEQPIVISTLNVPSAWTPRAEMDEPASCLAAFLVAGAPQPRFIAERVAWHPEKASEAMKVSPSQVLLSRAGMDVGLFDDVRDQNGRAVGRDDAECFYQMLSYVNQIGGEALLAKNPAPLDLAIALQTPGKLHGELVTVEGNARRVTKIVVDSPYIRDRLDLDHYYEIDIFLPLGNQDIRIRSKNDEGGSPVFRNNYPATVCVRRLPPGLSEGDEISTPIQVTCFFFKLWAYKSEFIREFGSQTNQVSPLLIGIEPEIVKYDQSLNPVIGGVLVGIVVVGLGGIWLGLWMTSKGDKKFARETLHQQFEVPEGKSLDNMGIEAQDGPDFSGLE